MSKKKKRKRRKTKGQSVQELIGAITFTRYGLLTQHGELVFYVIAPTNISVLSEANIEAKIHHLQMVLSRYPNLELSCTDAAECFDDNKSYLQNRLAEETNYMVRQLLQKDVNHLDSIQGEIASARQFLAVARIQGQKERVAYDDVNDIEKRITDEGFEVHRLRKSEIKRLLALYFDASMYGEHMPDIDGEQYCGVNSNET